MDFREEFLAQYSDEDGLGLEKPNSSAGPDTGNGILNLCVYIVLLHLRNELSIDDLQRFIAIIKSCQGALPRGLYSRGPRKREELIARDDIMALACASHVIGAPFAWHIFVHGAQHFWSFNNLDPERWTLRTCHARFPGMVSTYRLCAGLEPCSIDADLLAASIWFNAYSKKSGSKILTWLQIQVVNHRTDFIDEAVMNWKGRTIEVFPDGMASVFGDYYGHDHIFSRFCPPSERLLK